MKDEREYDLGDRGHIGLMFPSRYIKSADLRGREVTLTIDRVAFRDLRVQGGATERRPVVHFKEMQSRPVEDRKVLVLNKTNAEIIAGIHDQPNAGKWAGLRITLYPTTTNFGRKTVDCIRVKARVPADTKPSQTKPVDAPFTDDEVSNDPEATPFD